MSSESRAKSKSVDKSRGRNGDKEHAEHEKQGAVGVGCCMHCDRPLLPKSASDADSHSAVPSGSARSGHALEAAEEVGSGSECQDQGQGDQDEGSDEASAEADAEAAAVPPRRNDRERDIASSDSSPAPAARSGTITMTDSQERKGRKIRDNYTDTQSHTG